MLVNLAANIVATPMKTKKNLDVEKMHLYKREAAESKLKDPKTAATFLKNIRR